MIAIGNFGYLLATVSFIFGMNLMGKPKDAKKGNILMVVGMILAIGCTLLINVHDKTPWQNILIILAVLFAGTIIGKRISFNFEITRMPELISLFNGLGGICAVIIGFNSLLDIDVISSTGVRFLLLITLFFGSVSFAGSIIAYLKLGGKIKIYINNINTLSFINLIICLVLLFFAVNIAEQVSLYTLSALLTFFSLLYGISFALGVGGADMPVLISILNGITGIVTAISGIFFHSPIMILIGVFVSATGVILTVQMCKAMNRSVKQVFFNTKKVAKVKTGFEKQLVIQEISPSQLAVDLSLAKTVAIVPGFGLAAAQAQKLCFELREELLMREIDLKFIIHPVAGRMPGHMNVILAEANIRYDDILDMETGNQLLNTTDVCIIIGANDVVNTAAENDPQSPIFGMPIIKAYKAKKVIVIKRSLNMGYAGVPNPLFENENCSLLLNDAKEGLASVIRELTYSNS